ncbi:MAG: asparagine synthase B [Lachnospiraceae bacterium]|nr:asparagine synthase B [Lachnospiraceae bacterium]
MCSIMTYCDKEADLSAFEEGFEKTVSRGPDDSRIIPLQNGIMGFHRLAIMGLHPEGMQPFERDGSYVVCNGELYGFKAQRDELIKKGYTFESDSDCEILLPLYFEYGTDMFKMLDAEYACVIYDGRTGEYIAARDPIGIRPLYYGYGDNGAIVFASEPKNLVGICDKIMPFPPGHYYKNGEFIYYNDISKPAGRTSNKAGLLIHHDPEVDGEVYLKDDLETVTKNIHDKLVAGVEKRLVADAKVGFLLSGGLDSSLVCAIAAQKSDKPIRTFAIGMTEDAIDLKYAKQVADFIGSEHTEVYMTPEQVISSLEDVIHLLGTYDITTIRASMGMYLVCKAIHETTDIRVLLTGEISDELFGYKYTDFAPSAAEFQKEAEKRIHELHMYDVLRADRCISVNSLEARVPFGDLDFVKYVMSVDPEMKMNKYGKGKYLLRKAFDNGAYLPDEILWREKAAFSDAVGHSMVDYLKEYAEKQISDEEFEKECKKYTHATPFTKESLLYRQIFEKYYPGQSDMVVDFWMPNKNWEGCNVNDPSARVLSNYGDSGK